jgi:uncharacterized protein (TIGR03086 family)
VDLFDLYERASTWTTDLAAGAADSMDAPTPNEEWDVRTLLDHVLDTQRYFLATARGEEVQPPSPEPPRLVSDDPAADLRQVTREVGSAYAQEGVLERTGPSLGIAFADQLLHAWDLARATGQDDTMPEGTAEAAFGLLDGRLTDDRRNFGFGPAVPVADDAPAQARLLGYTGRDPR